MQLVPIADREPTSVPCQRVFDIDGQPCQRDISLPVRNLGAQAQSYKKSVTICTYVSHGFLPIHLFQQRIGVLRYKDKQMKLEAEES